MGNKIKRETPSRECIAEVEQAALQHLVGGGTDVRRGEGRIEGRLFNFGEIICGIAIQDNSAAFLFNVSTGLGEHFIP